MHTVHCSGRLSGVSIQEGVSVQGGLCAFGGVCLLGVHLPPPPWTEFVTYACENTTFLQPHLRMVKMGTQPIAELFSLH